MKNSNNQKYYIVIGLLFLIMMLFRFAFEKGQLLGELLAK